MRRRYTDDEIDEFFDEVDGRCPIRVCERPRLRRSAYGRRGEPGAWEVGHKDAVARGGGHDRDNLVALCVSCNLQMGTRRPSEFEDEVDPPTVWQRVVRFFGGDG